MAAPPSLSPPHTHLDWAAVKGQLVELWQLLQRCQLAEGLEARIARQVQRPEVDEVGGSQLLQAAGDAVVREAQHLRGERGGQRGGQGRGP